MSQITVGELIERLKKMDREVLEEFCKRYDFDEDEAYWRAGREVGEGLVGRG